MDLPLKPSRRIDCGCISRKVSSLYVCTKVVFFDVRKIALFTPVKSSKICLAFYLLPLEILQNSE